MYALRDFGSFHAGGRIVSVAGKEQRMVQSQSDGTGRCRPPPVRPRSMTSLTPAHPKRRPASRNPSRTFIPRSARFTAPATSSTACTA